MYKVIGFPLFFLLLFSFSGTVMSQNDPCLPEAVLSSFSAAALSRELENWVQRYQDSDCSTSVKSGVRVLAQGFGLITRTSVAGSDAEMRQWASDARATSQYGIDRFSALQATGAPNTPQCGDRATAWASRSSRGQDQLTVFFDRAVSPTEINIHQTFTPGSITGISFINAATGEEIEIENSASTDRTCPNVFQLSLELSELPPVNGVIITLDQTIGGNWNEIDAVELVGFPAE